jgi:hypothetical protein
MGENRRAGLSRGEVLVLAVIGVVLVGMLLPARQKVVEPVHRMRSDNNLRMLGVAAANYEAVRKRLPPAALPPDHLPPEDRLGWLMALTPYLELDHLHRKQGAWDSEPNRSAAVPVRAFTSSDAPVRDNLNTSFVGVAGAGPDAATLPAGDPRAGLFGYVRRGLASGDIRDGASNTMLAVEARGGPWPRSGWATLRPVDPAARPYIGRGRPFGVPHRASCGLLLADGSVRHVWPDLAPEVLEALATVAGKEMLPGDW